MSIVYEKTLYKNHGGTVGYWTVRADATEEYGSVLIIYAKKLDGKAVEKVYQVEQKNLGRANETSFIDQAVSEAKSRVNKQLDKGYVKTLEEAKDPATNSLGLHKPMLAQPIGKVKPEIIEWDTAFAQPKLDGHRCLVNDILYSRQGKEIKLPHIRDQLGDSGLLSKNLDGELYVHGKLLQDIGSLVKKPRKESLAIEYHIYDIVSPAPYSERLKELIGLSGQFGESVKLVLSVPCTSREELDYYHGKWIEQGYEGSILRHGPAGYETDKRSRSLLKVKDFDDTEFQVVGVTEGKPNGEYKVPVWTCQIPSGGTFRVTAHGDMRQKDYQWSKRDKLVGKVLTVQHFGTSKAGVPLLPVALRWREDL